MRHSRWYVDADTLGLARILAVARTDVTYCGDDGRRPKGLDLPPSPIQDTETADDVWIPAVTQAGMSIITRDKKLLTRPGELNAIAASRARVFTILVEDDPSNWGLLEAVASQWRAIQSAADLPGPYVYGVTRTVCHQIWPAPDHRR